MIEKDFEIEFYTKEELDVLDRMQLLCKNTLDDDEIYEIYLQNGRNETLTKSEVEKIYLKMKQQDYKWNVVANTKDGKLQQKQLEEKNKLKENKEKVNKKQKSKFRNYQERDSYNHKYFNNYSNDQMEKNYNQYQYNDKYYQNKQYFNNYSDNNYYSNNRFNQNYYNNQRNYNNKKTYDREGYSKNNNKYTKNNKYINVVVKELEHNVNNNYETDEFREYPIQEYGDDYNNHNEPFDLEPTEQKKMEEMLNGLTDDKSIEIDAFFGHKNAVNSSNSKRPETGKRKEEKKEDVKKETTHNQQDYNTHVKSDNMDKKGTKYPPWESSFHNLKETSVEQIFVPGQNPQIRQNTNMLNNNDMFLQYLQFQQLMSQFNNTGHMNMGMNDQMNMNMNIGNFTPNQNVFLPQNMGMGGNINKFNNMSKK